VGRALTIFVEAGKSGSTLPVDHLGVSEAMIACNLAIWLNASLQVLATDSPKQPTGGKHVELDAYSNQTKQRSEEVILRELTGAIVFRVQVNVSTMHLPPRYVQSSFKSNESAGEIGEAASVWPN
jgi:hypothetical protein